MKKQKTFTSRYSIESSQGEATEWLKDLASCFIIKKATIKTYTLKESFNKYRCKLEVEFE